MSFLNKKLSFFLIIGMLLAVLSIQNQYATWGWGSGSNDDTTSTGSTGSTGTDSDD